LKSEIAFSLGVIDAAPQLTAAAAKRKSEKTGDVSA
jgi:hypothetical protein